MPKVKGWFGIDFFSTAWDSLGSGFCILSMAHEPPTNVTFRGAVGQIGLYVRT